MSVRVCDARSPPRGTVTPGRTGNSGGRRRTGRSGVAGPESVRPAAVTLTPVEGGRSDRAPRGRGGVHSECGNLWWWPGWRRQCCSPGPCRPQWRRPARHRARRSPPAPQSAPATGGVSTATPATGGVTGVTPVPARPPPRPVNRWWTTGRARRSGSRLRRTHPWPGRPWFGLSRRLTRPRLTQAWLTRRRLTRPRMGRPWFGPSPWITRLPLTRPPLTRPLLTWMRRARPWLGRPGAGQSRWRSNRFGLRRGWRGGCPRDGGWPGRACRRARLRPYR